ncbi:NgoMIV family type II restriction endonuclease [Nocardia fusca]|uniref:NgoMIV family type II restriction endonuclease n=1 Tax=Nocardia fusca TaxID=941183 RepID=A0ABV3F8E7_9NOCA
MTAPFAAELCGYRISNGKPSTSDSNDAGSVEWGKAMFDVLGVPNDKPEVANIGSVMEQAAAMHLEGLRADLVVRQSRPAMEFGQYAHLAVFRNFARKYRTPDSGLADVIAEISEGSPSSVTDALVARLKAAGAAVTGNHELVSRLLDTMPEESMLKLDIAVAAPAPVNRLLIGVSSKWTLRTDRAQDCVSQGSKLVSLRRGHMPHYAVLTMEPRPSMLRLVAYGSGSVDCVYHLALQELREAAKVLEARRGLQNWPPRVLLERMVAQGRIRDYCELVAEVQRLPAWQ